jgi:hypothetical protein
MGAPAFLAPAIEWWSALYGDHQAVSVAVRYLHLAGIVVGGGTAIAADRRVLRDGKGGEDARRAALAETAAAHRVVVPALALVVATGALMAASDVETFLSSRAYWLKMGLFALLLLNGGVLLAAERAAGARRPTGWPALRAASAASLALWLAVLLAGVWLTVAA